MIALCAFGAFAAFASFIVWVVLSEPQHGARRIEGKS
jgi:hypothetical protein